MYLRPPRSTLFPYTTLFRSHRPLGPAAVRRLRGRRVRGVDRRLHDLDGRLDAGGREADGAVQLGLDRLLQLLEAHHGRAASLHLLPQPRDRVLLHPLALFFLRAVVGQVRAHAVAAPAIGHRLDQRRTRARARPRHGRLRRLVDGEDVVAVHADAGDAVGGRTPGDGLARGRPRARRRERVLVVLAEVDDRQLPDGGEVERLVDHALVGAPVAEERDDHAVRATDAVGERRSRADGQAGGHDAVTAEDVEVEGGDVHRAAETAAVAVDAAEQLGHHAVHARALGDAVPVAAVGADDGVVRAEVGARRRRHRLLADVGMRGALDQALHEQLRRLLVEPADLDHRGVETLEPLAVELHGDLRGANYTSAARPARSPGGARGYNRAACAGASRCSSSSSSYRPAAP